MSSYTTLKELRALVNFINTSFDEIEQACKAQHKDFPSPHEPMSHEAEAVRMSPEVMKAGNILESAAYQLVAALRLPMLAASSHVAQVRYSGLTRGHHLLTF